MHTPLTRAPGIRAGFPGILTTIFCAVAANAVLAADPFPIDGTFAEPVPLTVAAAPDRVADAKAPPAEAENGSRDRPARPTCAGAGQPDVTIGCGVGNNFAANSFPGMLDAAFEDRLPRRSPA
jgi:hypothetical protein